MTTTNYPNGFPFGVTVRNMPLVMTNPGKTWFVHNGTGGDGNPGTIARPFKTLNYASTRCGSLKGDSILLLPGHAETVSSATALAMAVAGVAVIGLGQGDNRPTFTLDTANTAAIAVSAANISFQNCKFVANFLSIASCFLLTTAKNFAVQNCEFKETSNVLNFLNIIKSTGAANTIDGLFTCDNVWKGLGTTSVNSFILTANDIDGAVINRNRVNLARTADASILLTVTAGVLTNFESGDNVVISKQTATTAGSLINVGGSTSTGVVYRNYAGTLTTAGDKLFTTTSGLYPYENRVSGAVGATGFVIPAVDS